MKSEPQEIEVEVVETIDSVPARRTDDFTQRETQGDPQGPYRIPWQGRVRRINLRWWPLWSILGLVLLIPLLVLGVIVAACWLVLRGLGRLLGGR